ncbi:MAG: hypothetical protein ACI845_000782 [Gammaproteobacteria bacterium]|jgi:hypothetical protein
MSVEAFRIRQQPGQFQLCRASVKGISSETFLIDLDGKVINAKKAFSCLVEPEVGDLVLVSLGEVGFFILSVLERLANQNISIKFPANVNMSAADGDFKIVASDDIDLLSANSTNISSKTVNLVSVEMNLNSVNLSARIHDIDTQSTNINIFTRNVSVVAHQISQKTDVLVRWVEKIETANIGNLVQKIRNNLMSHSNQATFTAKNDLRIDAERIHMG